MEGTLLAAFDGLGVGFLVYRDDGLEDCCLLGVVDGLDRGEDEG